MPGSVLCTSDCYQVESGSNQVGKDAVQLEGQPRAHSPVKMPLQALLCLNHLPKVLTVTFGSGSQSLVLQLAESLARRTEPMWSEQLQGLCPQGLQLPWLNAGALCKATTSQSWGPSTDPWGLGPAWSLMCYGILGKSPPPPSWASISWKVSRQDCPCP